MKILKTFNEFLIESDSVTTLKLIGDKEIQKNDINQNRNTSDDDKEKKFKEETKKQALNKTIELDKAAQDIKTRQKLANKKIEEIKSKQDLLPDDPNMRKEFLKNTDNDLKNVKSELNNAELQIKSLSTQKKRVQNTFLKK